MPQEKIQPESERNDSASGRQQHMPGRRQFLHLLGISAVGAVASSCDSGGYSAPPPPGESNPGGGNGGSGGTGGGSLEPPAVGLGQVGGGNGYARIVSPESADRTVNSLSQLKQAINDASAGETIFIEPGEYNFGGDTINLNKRLTIASNRGADGSKGALLYSDDPNARPFKVKASGGRFTGLRLRGPKPNWDGEGARQEDYAVGIAHNGGSNLEVDNCELLNWSAVAVAARGDGPIHYHHNYAHDNPGSGMGYGVQVGQDSGLTLIEYNYFDRNRHSIAGSHESSGYEAQYNINGPIMYNHGFDMHGGPESSAGEKILIHHNEFRATEESADSVEDGGTDCINIRGKPRDTCEVHHNWFYPSDKGRVVEQNGEIKYDQKDKYNGSAANKEALVNMKIYENHYGQSQPPDGVGVSQDVDSA